MFRALAAGETGGRTAVLTAHPRQLSTWLEERFAGAVLMPVFTMPATGSSGTIDDVIGNGAILSNTGLLGPPLGTASSFSYPGSAALLWDHLIYAYLIESTGVAEIAAEVVRRFGVGESLDQLSTAGYRWVRTTEDLFFSDPPLFSIAGVGSHLRPDARVARRNAYWRMFGMDLPHPTPARFGGSSAGQQWKVDLGAGVNTGFRSNWVELLRQVWMGIENRRNSSGANATDDEYVASVCRSLGDMMRMRRRGGHLAREEMVFVSMMNWFHLTLESPDSEIVVDLNAQASSPAERLNKIAARVGMTPAPRSRELFELADKMSTFLRAIELHFFDNGQAASGMYADPLPPGVPQVLQEEVNRIIDLWQSATGEVVKAIGVRVAASSGSAQPLRLPSPSAPSLPAVTGNGRTG